MITGNRKYIEQALETIRGMDSYMEVTPTLQIIADIKAYANSDRKNIATHTMAALINTMGEHGLTDFGDIAHDAVLAADKLITELNKAV